MSTPSQLATVQASVTNGLVDPMFAAYGFDCFLVVPAAQTFDAVKGEITSGPDIYIKARGVYGGTSSSTTFSAGLQITVEPKTATRKKSKTVNLQASTLKVDPDTDMQYQDENGELYDIVKVLGYTIGGPVLMWSITAKK